MIYELIDGTLHLCELRSITVWVRIELAIREYEINKFQNKCPLKFLVGGDYSIWLEEASFFQGLIG